DARRPRVAGFGPCRPIGPDLLSLLDVERLATLVEHQRRALKVHAELGCPLRRLGRGRAPPYALEQAFRMRLDAEQSRRIGKHGAWIGLGEPRALEHVQEDAGVPPRHVGVALAL